MKTLNKLSFPEKVEWAILNSRPETIENRVYKGFNVPLDDIRQRVNQLWREYDATRREFPGLVAVWLEDKLSSMQVA